MTPTVSSFFHSIAEIVRELHRKGWMEQDMVLYWSKFAHIAPYVKNDGD